MLTLAKNLETFLTAWVLKLFASRSTNPIDSLLIQEQLIELLPNKKLKLVFEQGWNKFSLQKKIPVLYSALCVTVRLNHYSTTSNNSYLLFMSI